MYKYIISIIFIYLLFGSILFIFQRKIIFNTSGKPKKPKYYGLFTIEEVRIPTKDGFDLLAWYSKPINNNPTMIYFHGNSFDIGERSHRIEKYIENGWGILLLAWRGYSGNKGKPTEFNLYHDAESSFKWIEQNTPTMKNNIIIYGESLGAGVAVEMATRYTFKSIVLEAPFTSIFDLALKRYKLFPFKFLVLDKFDNISKINKIFSPVMIISGKNDEIVPHSHSLRLFSKANQPKQSVFIDEAMHNNLYEFCIDKHVINFNS